MYTVPVLEAELHHAHARQTRMRQKLVDVVVYDAEIFGYERIGGMFLKHFGEELLTDALAPFSLFRCDRVRVYRPVCAERPEMVYAEHVVQFRHSVETSEPPSESVFAHLSVIVERIAPQLSVLAEIIGRNARDLCRSHVFVQFELRRISPYVRAVQADVHGHIAYQPYLLFRKHTPDLAPLGVEDILFENVITVSFGKLVFQFLFSGNGRSAVFFFPFPPRSSAVRVLYRHEQRVISQPRRTRFISVQRSAVAEICERAAQQRALGSAAKSVIDGVGIIVARFFGVLARYKSVADQPVRIDVHEIARKSAGAGIGRPPGTYGGHGQSLPVMESALDQKIRELFRFRAESAYAVFRRKGRDVEQYAATPVQHNFSSSPRSARAASARVKKSSTCSMNASSIANTVFLSEKRYLSSTLYWNTLAPFASRGPFLLFL